MGSGIRVIGVLTWGISLVFLPGCYFPFLSKSNDAQMEAVHTAAKLSILLERQSNLTRVSGRALSIRLTQLFPGQAALVSPEKFSLEEAINLNRSIAQIERPVSALEQIAVKALVNQLCEGETLPPTYPSTSGGIYSSKVWFTSENASAVKDEAVLAAMVVSRNAWLEPYAADSAEISTLAQLYRDVSANQPGETATASAMRVRGHRAVCVAALTAAQFTMGSPGPRDGLRRMLVEVAGRVPTFAELEAVSLGTKTIVDFLDEAQSNRQSGYYTAIHQWHNDWLGLRKFIDTASTSDPRTIYAGTSGVSGFSGMAPYYTTLLAGSSVPVVRITDYPDKFVPIYPPSVPTSIANQQAFDPRTAIMYYDYRETASSPWEVFGAFVQADFVDYYIGQMNLLLPASSQLTRADCTSYGFPLMGSDPATLTRVRRNMPLYYTCKGRIHQQGQIVVPQALNQDLNVYQAYTFYTNSQIRRFAPGWINGQPAPKDQNGYSYVKTWYSGEGRWIHNTVSRYLATCFLRARSGTSTYTMDGGYFHPYSVARLGSGFLYWLVGGFANAKLQWQYFNPQLLPQFHCGVPNESAFYQPFQLGNPTDDPTFAYEDAALPWGFNPAQAPYGADPVGPLNDVMSMAVAVSEVGNEALAIKRLRDDLYKEPYRLLDEVVAKNQSYQDFFTANYTFGHTELRLLYATHGLAVPARPSAYRLPSFDPAAPLERISQNDGDSGLMHSNMVTKSELADFRGDNTSAYRRSHTPYRIGVRPAAGVLSMPAFIAPVGGKMRTLSSRYFLRLLCGDPSSYAPTGGEKSTHEKYMLSPEINPTASQHFTLKTCYACHVNLDPLGAALGANFLKSVQTGQDDITGEMGSLGSLGGILGVDFSGPKGVGAFLGSEVIGVEGVANKLVQSDKWARCVVEKTFLNVFGRPVLLSDVKEKETWVNQFEQDHQFNHLVRSMVISKLYQGEN